MPKTQSKLVRVFAFAVGATVAVVSVGAVAGCGGGSEGGEGPSAGSVTVELRDDLTFAPRRVAVAPGATVAWHNTGKVPHDVVATRGARFRSPVVPAGGHFETTVERAGTVAYRCTLHPGMDGTILVEEAR